MKKGPRAAKHPLVSAKYVKSSCTEDINLKAEQTKMMKTPQDKNKSKEDRHVDIIVILHHISKS
jgi:hypothetical protein